MSAETDADWHVKLDEQDSALSLSGESYDASPVASFGESYDASPVASFGESYDSPSP
jgi:hypothetical protein